MTATDRKVVPPIVGLLRGMSVTLKNFFRRSVTVQYPEERAPLPERFRGRLALHLHKCIGCSMCYQVCPNGTITMVQRDRDAISVPVPQKKEKYLFPQVDIAMCTYCGWCEYICPTAAIFHTKQFELSRYDRKNFVYTPEMLAKTEEELLREAQQRQPMGAER